MEFLSDVMMMIAQCQMVGKMPLDPVQQPVQVEQPVQQVQNAV
jgi:hypothetical protein